MIKLIKKIWKDSVGSNLIASGLIAIISLVYSLLISITGNIDFKSAFISFWTIKLELWIILSLLIMIVFILRFAKGKKRFVYDAKEIELDRQLFEKIRDVLLPQNCTIAFLRHNNFAGFSFDLSRIDDIYEFENEKQNPNFQFFHPNLELIKNKLMGNIEKFTYTIAGETFPTSSGRQSVPEDWEDEQPERFERVVKELHSTAKEICENYDELIKSGRNILKV